MIKLNIVVRFDLRQEINQWLCVALLAVIGFSIALYYLTHQTVLIGDAFVAGTTLVE